MKKKYSWLEVVHTYIVVAGMLGDIPILCSGVDLHSKVGRLLGSGCLGVYSVLGHLRKKYCDCGWPRRDCGPVSSIHSHSPAGPFKLVVHLVPRVFDPSTQAFSRTGPPSRSLSRPHAASMPDLPPTRPPKSVHTNWHHRMFARQPA